jgi:hypothetical protein
LLVDVDGVISLFGFDHTSPPGGFPVSVDGTPHWLADGAAARLARLDRTFECVWCMVGITDDHVAQLEAWAREFAP